MAVNVGVVGIVLCALILVLTVGVNVAHGSGTTTTGTLGYAVSVSANTETTITYTAGPTLVILVSQAAQVTLSAYATVSTSLPAGFSELSFGTDVGFTLDVSPSSAFVSASLTTPPVTAGLNAGVTAGCLGYNVSAQSYTYVDFAVYSSTSSTITVPLPWPVTYVFVAVSAGAALPTWYGSQRHLNSAENYTLTYEEGLTLQVQAASSTNLTTDFYTTNPAPNNPSNEIAYGAFFDFTLSTSTSVQADIQYSYSSATVSSAGINAATLKIGYYDSSSSSWTFPSSGGSVNTQTSVVSQTTTHFSTWGVYGSGTTSSKTSDAALTSAAAIAVVVLAALAPIIM